MMVENEELRARVRQLEQLVQDKEEEEAKDMN